MKLSLHSLRSLVRSGRKVVGAARELRAHVDRVGDAAAVLGDVLDGVARIGDAVTGAATRQGPAPATARRITAPKPAPRTPTRRTAPRRAPSEREPGPVIDVPDEDVQVVAPTAREPRR